MTRSEAKEILESVSFFAPSDIDVDTAIDMANEALEQCEMAYEHGWTDAESEYRKILERKHGEWIIQDGKVVCSECFEPNFETNYCPNCGADMRDSND